MDAATAAVEVNADIKTSADTQKIDRWLMIIPPALRQARSCSDIIFFGQLIIKFIFIIILKSYSPQFEVYS